MYNHIICNTCDRHDVSDCEHSAATAVQAEHRQQATILTEM